MSPEHAGEWVRKAEADGAAARWALKLSLKRKDQAEISCFHAQQCAEKYLKAIYARVGRPIPRIHDLRSLAQSLERLGFPLEKLDRLLRQLNEYAVEVRYPGASATVADAKRALAAMERVVKAAKTFLTAAGSRSAKGR